VNDAWRRFVRCLGVVAVAVASSGATGASGFSTPVPEPREIVQGGVFVVRWTPAEPVSEIPEIRCMGRVVPMARWRDAWMGVVGVDLQDPPGPRTCLLTTGPRTAEMQVKVLRGDFPEERLTLPKEMVSPTGKTLERIKTEARLLSAFWPRAEEPLWGGEDFAMPLTSEIITPFGVRRIMNGIPKNPHKGLDLKGTEGTAVRSMNRGRVVLAQELYYGGLTVIVDHGAGIYSYYMHLSKVAAAIGDTVAKGQVVGSVGRSGRATGPHLHFGVKIAGANVDPLALVNVSLEEDIR